MTPKEKAQELFYKMLKHSFSDKNVSALHRAKQCALIAVYEIIEMLSKLSKDSDLMFKDEIAFWEQTIQEINNI